MVAKGAFIRRISYVRRKIADQCARLLELLAFALLNRGFGIYDSESDPQIFLIKIRKEESPRITRDLSEGVFQDSASSPSSSAVPSFEWQSRESIYKSSETDEVPSAKT
jgi:hypothetical protein